MLRCAAKRCAMLCPILCYAMLCPMQCYAMVCHAMLCYDTTRYDTTLYYMMRHRLQSDTVVYVHETVRCDTLWYDTACYLMSYGRRNVFCIETLLPTPCIRVSILWGYKGAFDNLYRIHSAYGISCHMTFNELVWRARDAPGSLTDEIRTPDSS